MINNNHQSNVISNLWMPHSISVYNNKIHFLESMTGKFYSGNYTHIFLNLEGNKIWYQITFYFKSYLQRGNTLSSQIATM